MTGVQTCALPIYAGSRRAVSPAALAAIFAPAAGRCARIAVTVDPDDALVEALAASGAVDQIQLHGHETPARAAAIKARTGLGIVKALAVAAPHDVAAARDFEGIAAAVLFDAKAPAGAPPGGNGLVFDWRLLVGAPTFCPGFGLAGGLGPANVAAAIRTTGAGWVDVASGVETAPGIKDHAAIAAFVAAAQQTDAGKP